MGEGVGKGTGEDVYSFIKADLPDNHCDMTGITPNAPQ